MTTTDHTVRVLRPSGREDLRLASLRRVLAGLHAGGGQVTWGHCDPETLMLVSVGAILVHTTRRS